jgi:hypothetical protein
MPPSKAGAKPASPRKSIASLLFKQYPGQQQVDLKVKIEVPGSWFGAGNAGGLQPAEKREKYDAVAMQFDEKHLFASAVARKPAKVGPAIRFVCHADAADDANHSGFWVELPQWNRWRHDTYKDRREDEVCRYRRCRRCRCCCCCNCCSALCSVRAAAAAAAATADIQSPARLLLADAVHSRDRGRGGGCRARDGQEAGELRKAKGQYDFLRPSLEEIVAEYKKVHGPEPSPEELDEDEGEGEGEGEVEGEDEGKGEGDEQ